MADNDTSDTVLSDSRYPDAFDEVTFYVGRAYYDHLRLLETLLEETGLDKHLAPGMGQVLFNLFEKNDVIIKDLKQRLRCSPSHLTAVLGKMEKAGVIKRRTDENDSRAVRVSLTDLGFELERRSRAMLRSLNDIMCKGMSEDEIQQMKNNLQLMVDNAAEYRNDKSVS